MKATIILADFAQVVAGKLYIMGGGWSVTEPKLAQSAIAGKIEVPYAETNKKHALKIELLDSDQKPVLVPTAKESSPLVIGGEFTVGNSPDLPAGTPSDVPFAFSIRPLSLEPGKKYIWKLSIDANTKEDWQMDFFTRTAPMPPVA